MSKSKDSTYFFKHEAWGDDWEERTSDALDEFYFAEELAEKYWVEDPSNPNDFEFEVEVRREGKETPIKIVVTASCDVSFYAKEIT